MFLLLFGMGKCQGTRLWPFIILKHQQLTFTGCLLCLGRILLLLLLYRWGNWSSVKLGSLTKVTELATEGIGMQAQAAWLQLCHSKPFLCPTGALLEQFLSCESSLLWVHDPLWRCFVRCVAPSRTEVAEWRSGSTKRRVGMMASPILLGIQVWGVLLLTLKIV